MQLKHSIVQCISSSSTGQLQLMDKVYFITITLTIQRFGIFGKNGLNRGWLFSAFLKSILSMPYQSILPAISSEGKNDAIFLEWKQLFSKFIR